MTRVLVPRVALLHFTFLMPSVSIFSAFAVLPPTPHILINSSNETLKISLPYILAGYEILNYNISLVTISDCHRQITTVIVNAPSHMPLMYLLPSRVQPCSKYELFVSTVSPTFGSSIPAQLEFITPRGLASM